MSYVDANNNPLDNQGDPNPEHGARMSFMNAEQNTQWHVCTSRISKWWKVDNTLAFQPREAIGFAMMVAGMAPNSTKQWNAMMFGAAEIARVLGGIMKIITIKPYDTWSALVDAGMVAFEKLSSTAQAPLAFQEDGLIDCVGDPLPQGWTHLSASESWEDVISYGMVIKGAGKGGLALLELSALDGRNFFVENPALHLAARTEVKMGRLDEDTLETAQTADGDDDVEAEDRTKLQARVARAVVAAFGRAGNLPACLRTNPPDPEDFTEALAEAFDGESHQFDGDSAFMLGRTPFVVAAIAPTLHKVLSDAQGQGETNSHLVQLASTCPKDTVETHSKRLLTVAGIRKLERYISMFDGWASSDTAKDMHIRTRVAQLCDRINSHSNAGGLARCARRVNPAAPYPPHQSHCRA